MKQAKIFLLVAFFTLVTICMARTAVVPDNNREMVAHEENRKMVDEVDYVGETRSQNPGIFTEKNLKSIPFLKWLKEHEKQFLEWLKEHEKKPETMNYKDWYDY